MECWNEKKLQRSINDSSRVLRIENECIEELSFLDEEINKDIVPINVEIKRGIDIINSSFNGDFEIHNSLIHGRILIRDSEFNSHFQISRDKSGKMYTKDCVKRDRSS